MHATDDKPARLDHDAERSTELLRPRMCIPQSKHPALDGQSLHEYNADFYGFLTSFAVRSAEQIVPLLTAELTIGSVADFGCGQGAWLSVWRKAGAAVVGVDGPYVDRRHLMIEQSEFRAADLGSPIALGRRFDLVQSLEVAEHLPAERASAFIDTLTAHGPLVLFSAAIPGQGGEHHVNEQPLEYWRAKFRDRSYLAVDCIRPQVAGHQAIQNWYRNNIFSMCMKAARRAAGAIAGVPCTRRP